VKIDQYLAKIWTKCNSLLFGHPIYAHKNPVLSAVVVIGRITGLARPASGLNGLLAREQKALKNQNWSPCYHVTSRSYLQK